MKLSRSALIAISLITISIGIGAALISGFGQRYTKIECPRRFNYDGLEVWWRPNVDIPNNLVVDYARNGCFLYQTLQDAIQGNRTVDDILEAQKKYLESYLKILAIDQGIDNAIVDTKAEDVSTWLEYMRQARVVPLTYTVTENERVCYHYPSDVDMESYCHTPLVLTAEDLTVSTDLHIIRQDHGAFTVSRYCETPVTKDGIEQIWDCEVINIQEDETPFHAYTALAFRHK